MKKLIGKQALIYVDEKYDEVYELFNRKQDNEKGTEITGMKIKDLFLIMASIGFKNTKKIKMKKNGSKQFRSNYLIPEEESLLYTMALSDSKFNNNIEKLSKDESTKEIIEIAEEYANGGMELVIENVFRDYWDGEKLSANYDGYHYDLGRYIAAQVKNVPF